MNSSAILGVLVVTLSLGSPQAGAADWINARDCGASGSTFETTAKTAAASKQITVATVGDFKVGQGVMVSKCNIRYTRTTMWGTGNSYENSKKPGNSVEVRGYDGSAGSWLVFVLDIAPGKREFRWTDDLGRNWHPAVPITHDWQPLSGGVEVRLNQRDWESGYVISFGARDQLVTTVEKIEGNVLTLKDAANRSVKDALVRHNDGVAIQAAIDRGIKDKRNVYLPVGHYRLARGVTVKDAAAITIEGQSAVDTLLDLSEGEGTCIHLIGGTEVTLRDFRMVGFMGFDEADRAGSLATKGASAVWGLSLKTCQAVETNGTERVLVENCHASRMSCECFQSACPGRTALEPGQFYTKAITYLRCSVTDCARNGFDECGAGVENVSILNCRIVDVGGCSWEGVSRFGKFIGNYVRNSGPVVARFGPEHRDKSFPDLGVGQHVFADNVFEGNVSYAGRVGGAAIRSNGGTAQVIVRNNLFINFNSSGVDASNPSASRYLPSSNTTIVGNIFDLTCVGQEPVRRTAVEVSSNDAIVADNQIYIRGKCDPMVTGIMLHEPALNMNVHDNLIRNCGVGIATDRARSRVGEVVDSRTFLRADGWPRGLPLDPLRPWLCAGWGLAWVKGSKPAVTSTIESFDSETFRFKLREPHPMKVGDLFEVIVPALNWNMHDNTVTGCQRPVVLDSHGSDTCYFRNNLVERGGAADAKRAIEVRGQFRLIENQVVGFDEKRDNPRAKP
jgi:hypothetical protein